MSNRQTTDNGWSEKLEFSAQVSLKTKQKEAYGPHRSLESPWPILKYFLFIYAFYFFFCDHYKQFHVTYKVGHCLGTPQAYTRDLGLGISTVLEIIRHILFKGERPWDHPVLLWLHIITCSLTQGTRIYIWCMGWDLNGFDILEHLRLKWHRTIPNGHNQHTIKCSLSQWTRIYMV
jgi:hypothetical protein